MSFVYFFSLLTLLDLFKTPVIIKFEKKEKNSTTIGILLSIGIIIFLGVSFSQNDVFKRQLPTIANIDVTHANRPLITYSNKLFAISISDSNSVCYSNETIFEIKATNSYMQANSSGNGFDFVKNITKTLHLCQPSDFIDDEYYKLGLDGAFCLDENFFETEGYWDGNFLTYFAIEVDMCDNKTMNNTCQSPQEIADFLNGKTFNVYYVGTSLDPLNYLTPTQSIVYNDFYYIDASLRKNLAIFLKNLAIMTDDGYISSNNNTIQDILFDTKELDMYYLPNLNNSQSFFICTFYSSRLSQNIQRTYLKLLDAISNLGGMANIAMIFGFLIISIENSLSLKKNVMNCLYSFQDINQLKEKVEIRRKSSKMPNLKIFPENLPKSMSNPDNNNEPAPLSKIPYAESRKQTVFFKKDDIGHETEFNNQNLMLEMKEKNTNEDNFIPPTNEIMNTLNFFPEVENQSPNLENEFEKNCNYKIPSVQDEPLSSSRFHLRSMTYKRNLQKPPSIKMDKKIKNLEQFHDFLKESPINSKITFNILEYVKLNFKQVFKLQLDEKEQLFIKGEEIYDDELDIVHILKKIQEIEKIKMVLFNEDQRDLFNLIDKPMIYVDDFDFENNKNFENCSAQLKMSKMIQSSKTLDGHRLKRIFEHFFTMQRNNEMSPMDTRLMDLIDSNLTAFASNFLS